MHSDLAEYDAWARKHGLDTWGASLTEDDTNRMHDAEKRGAMGFEDIQKGLADAIKDIREKVVEEGYFGRSLSGPEQIQVQEQAPEWPQAKDLEAGQEQARHEHEREQQDRGRQDRDQGMER